MSVIEVSEVSKAFLMAEGRKVPVLQNVNFKVEQGESVAICGRSGSGKSTLLHILSGLILPDDGKVLVLDKELSLYKENERCDFRNRFLGFVFQAFYLEQSMTALENVALPLIVQGIGKKERNERAMDVLRKVGLEDRSGHKPSELSGGEQQRVCIARAIVTEPRILFADEPTGNLDEKNSNMIMELLLGFTQKNTSVILVTHEQEDAKRCSRILHLVDGRISDL
ncbi:MAG: ABC transporter ATP-binding protein [Lachnospiraceae bacterium]|nr:ABC transporter ATP-binding protein [Lachnospiraceae bacterium]